ncbi:MAG: hypothetical protein ACKOAN_05030 [Chakrabartia sp.]
MVSIRRSLIGTVLISALLLMQSGCAAVTRARMFRPAAAGAGLSACNVNGPYPKAEAIVQKFPYVRISRNPFGRRTPNPASDAYVQYAKMAKKSIIRFHEGEAEETSGQTLGLKQKKPRIAAGLFRFRLWKRRGA